MPARRTSSTDYHTQSSKGQNPFVAWEGRLSSFPDSVLKQYLSDNNRKSRVCMNDSHDNPASGGQQDHSRHQFLYSLQQLSSVKTVIKPIFQVRKLRLKQWSDWARSQTQMYLTLNFQVSVQPKVESEIDGFLILFNHFHVNWFHSL